MNFSDFLAFEMDLHTIIGALEMLGVTGVLLTFFNKQFAPVYAWLVGVSSKLPTAQIKAAILALQDGELTMEEVRQIVEAQHG